jgi:probable DNA metabolism protein
VKKITEEKTIIYLYDGTYDGFLCCVYESFKNKETPADILLFEEAQLTLYETLRIEKSYIKARKTEEAIKTKISEAALHLIKKAFLTSLEGRELAMLSFLRRGFKEGRGIMNRLAAPEVEPLLRAVNRLSQETEKYRGFIRFSDLNGALVTVINPINQVLPFLAPHFCDRYPDEVILIYDKNHCSFLLCDKGKYKLGYMDEFVPAEIDEKEKSYRAMWQSFYKTIAIKERYNPRCRMGHMPKRYWSYMTEFWEQEAYNENSIKDTDKGRALTEQ